MTFDRDVHFFSYFIVSFYYKKKKIFKDPDGATQNYLHFSILRTNIYIFIIKLRMNTPNAV